MKNNVTGHSLLATCIYFILATNPVAATEKNISNQEIKNTNYISQCKKEIGSMIDKGYQLPYLWDSYSGYKNTNWMAKLSDQTRLYQMSIPGTHNSMALHGGHIPKTQTLDIPSQLEMGIRYFDARFKYIDGDLYAYHGIISQFMKASEFFTFVNQFLAANPSEAIFIRIHNEAGASNNAQAFTARLKEVLQPYFNQNKIANLAMATDNLAKVRGKIVIFEDFNNNHQFGINYNTLLIQDNYHLNTNWDLYAKWEKVKAHFGQVGAYNSISINYLSGSGGSFPYFVASGKSSPGSHDPQLWTGVSTTNKNKYPDFPRVSCLGWLCSINFAGTNQLTDKWINDGKFSGNLGIVAMDFPGAGLVKNIIETNCKTQEQFINAENNDNSQQDNENSDVIVPTAYDLEASQGEKLEITSDIPDLSSLNFNNKISSWDIPAGWTLRFFSDANYQGEAFTRTGKDDASDNLNNRLSSVQVIKKP